MTYKSWRLVTRHIPIPDSSHRKQQIWVPSDDPLYERSCKDVLETSEHSVPERGRKINIRRQPIAPYRFPLHTEFTFRYPYISLFMFAYYSPCQIKGCSATARGEDSFCYVCRRYLCRSHFDRRRHWCRYQGRVSAPPSSRVEAHDTGKMVRKGMSPSEYDND
jgi:hypothetical protein